LFEVCVCAIECVLEAVVMFAKWAEVVVTRAPNRMRDRVVDLASSRRASTAAESAGAVAGFDVANQCGWWSVGVGVDRDHRAVDGVGDDSPPCAIAGDFARCFSGDRPVADKLARSVADAEEHGRRHGELKLTAAPGTQLPVTASLRSGGASDELGPAILTVDGVTLDKVNYEGFGLFVIRVPDDMNPQNAMRIARAWDASWSKTDTPRVPMTVMAQSLRMDRLTERQMQSLGYMRIPSELTGPG
jgi:hypothetical protein